MAAASAAEESDRLKAKEEVCGTGKRLMRKVYQFIFDVGEEDVPRCEGEGELFDWITSRMIRIPVWFDLLRGIRSYEERYVWVFGESSRRNSCTKLDWAMCAVRKFCNQCTDQSDVRNLKEFEEALKHIRCQPAGAKHENDRLTEPKADSSGLSTAQAGF